LGCGVIGAGGALDEAGDGAVSVQQLQGRAVRPAETRLDFVLASRAVLPDIHRIVLPTQNTI